MHPAVLYRGAACGLDRPWTDGQATSANTGARRQRASSPQAQGDTLYIQFSSCGMAQRILYLGRVENCSKGRGGGAPCMGPFYNTPPPQGAPVRKIILQMHTPARTSQCWSRQTQHVLGVCIWMHLVNGTGNSPSPGQLTPE